MKASLASPEESTSLLHTIPNRVRGGSGTLLRSARANSPKPDYKGVCALLQKIIDYRTDVELFEVEIRLPTGMVYLEEYRTVHSQSLLGDYLGSSGVFVQPPGHIQYLHMLKTIVKYQLP